MYLEGGDVWYQDPTQGGYDFAPYFCINAVSNNSGYFSGALGTEGTFTQGMEFDYTGENSSIDRIDPTGTGMTFLTNAFNGYGCGIAANHQTVGLSIEYSGLVDGVPPSTKTIFIDSIMHYFGIFPTGVKETPPDQCVTLPTLSIYPNPCRGKTNIQYSIGHSAEGRGQSAEGIGLRIYDVSGRLVKKFLLSTDYYLLSTIIWDGTDEHGRRVSEGVYFVHLEARDVKKTKKIILLR
jgi:hypothetical protein